ncbi:MAG: hypothetical protein M1825_000959 [Sarcosagium campestre]|nr:MAG: hypothetical protein M1825_000959 [Sarcosagium campestre]
MNVNKKLGRFKQWAGERMGGEARTRMERLQKAMTVYVKSLSKTKEAEDKEKILPVAYLGSTMIGHGEEFEQDSEFGSCLMKLGRTNERISRVQEAYVSSATSNWLESLERSLAQMKEYQAARKKLEARRLAYDASLSKMQKAKREDFRVEEELRSQKAKYEESSEDVYRRMQDIKEAEVDSVSDLGAFLDAELEYYDKCRDALVKLKQDWPAKQDVNSGRDGRRPNGSRGQTAHSYSNRFDDPPPEPTAEVRSAIRSNRVITSNAHEATPRGAPQPHSTHGKATAFEGPTMIRREDSPLRNNAFNRVNTDPSTLSTSRSRPRPQHGVNTTTEIFGDASDESLYSNSSPEQYCGERAASPATSYGSVPSRNASSTALHLGSANSKRAPPPPPPSRAKKPPPPPPPMKRSALSTTNQHYA